jgi:hypothetical protein
MLLKSSTRQFRSFAEFNVYCDLTGCDSVMLDLPENRVFIEKSAWQMSTSAKPNNTTLLPDIQHNSLPNKHHNSAGQPLNSNASQLHNPIPDNQ